MPDRSTASHNPPGASATPRRGVPPLVWIVIGLLAAWIAWTFIARGETHVTPQGGTMPQPRPEQAYMPPAPANGTAPATKGGLMNTPLDKGESGVAPQATTR